LALKTLAFWQSVTILILAGILFGGYRVIQIDWATATLSTADVGHWVSPRQHISV